MKIQRKTALKRIFNAFLIILLIVLVLLLILGILLAVYVSSITEREIDQTVFEVLSQNSASKIYYYKSERLIYQY